MQIKKRQLKILIENYLMTEEEQKNDIASFKKYLEAIASQKKPSDLLILNQKKLTQIGPSPVKKGDKYPKGQVIKFIQRILGMKDDQIDGEYGDTTATVLKAFQEKKSISPDFKKENQLHNDLPGIIGHKTALALLDAYNTSLKSKSSKYDNESEEAFIDYIDKGKNEVHYRLTTSGKLYRFGVLKNSKWTMDDPALEYKGEEKIKVAQLLMDSENIKPAVKEKLKKIVGVDKKSSKYSIAKFLGTGGEITTKFANTIINTVLRSTRKTSQAAGAPIHLLAFFDYCMGRTTTFTENDLNDRYKKDLVKCAQLAMKAKDKGKPVNGRILGSNTFVYKKFWQSCSNALGQGELNTPIDNPPGPKGAGPVEELMYFLGGMTVRDEGANYVITDIYDFDDYYGNAASFDEYKDFVDDMSKEDYLKIRSLASWRQSTGYSGFRVEITLSKTLLS